MRFIHRTWRARRPSYHTKNKAEELDYFTQLITHTIKLLLTPGVILVIISRM